MPIRLSRHARAVAPKLLIGASMPPTPSRWLSGVGVIARRGAMRCASDGLVVEDALPAPADGLSALAFDVVTASDPRRPVLTWMYANPSGASGHGTRTQLPRLRDTTTTVPCDT